MSHVKIPNPFAWGIVDGKAQAISPLSIQATRCASREVLSADQKEWLTEVERAVSFVALLLWSLEDYARDKKWVKPMQHDMPLVLGKVAHAWDTVARRPGAYGPGVFSAMGREALCRAVFDAHQERGRIPVGFLLDSVLSIRPSTQQVVYRYADGETIVMPYAELPADQTAILKQAEETADVEWVANDTGGNSAQFCVQIDGTLYFFTYRLVGLRPRERRPGEPLVRHNTAAKFKPN